MLIIQRCKPFHLLLMLSIVFYTSTVALAAERTITTSDQLLDRINIEDMFHDYYLDLGSEDRSDISKFWAKDGVFEIDGSPIVGLAAIQALYDNTDGRPEGTLITLMGNPRISITGTTATAYMIYTTIRSLDPMQAPTVFEQGQDYVELEKIDGIWMIKRRILSNYGIDADALP